MADREVVVEVYGRKAVVMDVPRACPVCGERNLKPAYINRYGEVTWACPTCDTWVKDWAARVAGAAQKGGA